MYVSSGSLSFAKAQSDFIVFKRRPISNFGPSFMFRIRLTLDIAPYTLCMEKGVALSGSSQPQITSYVFNCSLSSSEEPRKAQFLGSSLLTPLHPLVFLKDDINQSLL